MSDRVSIVVPCLNEERYIESCILSLLNSDYPADDLEIIIIDGGSTDLSPSIIDRFKDQHTIIKVFQNPDKITPVSLNIGIKNSTGDYILIASAHSCFPAEYIHELMKLMHGTGCDVIGGGIDTRVINSNPVSEAIVKVLSSGFGVGNSKFRTEKSETIPVDTVPFGIYKKQIFTSAGLYNENLVRNHDIEFSKRLAGFGFKILLVSSIRCIYYARENYRDLAKNSFSNGLWNIMAVYITKRFSSLSLRHFIPLIFVLSLIIPGILALIINWRFALVTVISALSYIGLIVMASLRLRTELAGGFKIFMGFLVLHTSYGAGSLAGLFHIGKLIKRF